MRAERVSGQGTTGAGDTIRAVMVPPRVRECFSEVTHVENRGRKGFLGNRVEMQGGISHVSKG